MFRRQQISDRAITVLLIVACSYGWWHSLAFSQEINPPKSKIRQDAQVTPTICQRCHSRECQCELASCPKKVIETEEIPYWKVACENICVPGFRFPWEKCSGPVCGWVRTVKVLELDKYECETCGYEWTVKCIRTSSEPRQRCKCPRCQRESR